MKKFSSIFLFLLISQLSLQAQQYEPLLKPGAFWDFEVTGDSAGGSSPCSYSQRRYLVDQDTLINGHTYKKVIRYPLQGTPHPEHDVCIVDNFYYDGNIFIEEERYLREDIANQTIYIWTKVIDINTGVSTGDFKELVLYKFNVEVGDVIPNSYKGADYYSDYGYEVTETVTSVSISSSGKKIISTNLSGYEEGLGSDYSLFKVGPILNTPQFLFCHGNSTTPNTCASILSSENYQLQQIKVFPNPVTDKISFSNLENNTFKLYSILGKEMSFEFSKENQEMNISHLQSGIYFLEIRGNNGARKLIKVIKT